MASYASLLSLSLQHVLEQILHLDDQHSSVDGAKQQMKNLHENIISLVTFLDDFPEDAGDFLDQHIQKAANQAEDIIERQISDEMHLEYRRRPSVLSVFPAHRIAGGMELQLQDWQKVLEELQGVMKEVESIVEEVMRIKSSSRKKDPILSDLPASASGSLSSGLAPADKDTTAFGLEQESLEIRERLCRASSKLEVIPIIGMGGIGKTTLARYVYNDSLIVYHFKVRAWITVSQNYHTKYILSSILYDVNPSTDEQYNSMSEEKLLLCLRQFLCGRTYLIVLDDVWDASAWEVLRQAFPNDSNGSRIIIISRNEAVAPDVDPANLHKMELLDKDKSWKLFKEKAFAQEYCPPKLEKIGMFIAEKCGGLPLAIVVIAGMLSQDRMQNTWERIAHNVNEAVNSSDGKLTNMLHLSYKHLPQHLKPCFLYMGGFPEDYEIGVSKLIKLWVAEGFLKLKRSEDPEKVAKEYLEDLTKRSLVLVMKRKSNGNIKTCKIHDLLRQLSLKIAEKEKFLQEMQKDSLSFQGGIKNGFFGMFGSKIAEKEKFLQEMQKDSPSFQEDIQNARRVTTSSIVLDNFRGSKDSSIRTILLPYPDVILYMPWNSFKLLRVLDARDATFMYFPVAIGQLFCLKYLAVKIYMVQRKFEIPEFISQLQNLQTLVIMPFGGKRSPIDVIYSLPSGIWRLTRLRHLILYDVYLPDPSAGLLMTLENFHTLSRVACFTCSDRMLKLAPNLNKLEIVDPKGDETEWSAYMLQNLVHFQFLKKLNIDVERRPNYYLQALQKSDIAFPQALKKLSLRGCRLPWQDMTMIGSLPNLKVLKLRKNAFCGDKWEPIEGEFCRLKVLLIEESDPRQWVTESSHFPCLQSLLLVRCSQLTEIPAIIGEIDTLQLIELDYCKPHIEESAKVIEDEQRNFGNVELQVRILHASSDDPLRPSRAIRSFQRNDRVDKKCREAF